MKVFRDFSAIRLFLPHQLDENPDKQKQDAEDAEDAENAENAENAGSRKATSFCCYHQQLLG